MLCPLQCWCGEETQSCYSRYCTKIQAGATMKEALDTCGLPTSTAFAPPKTSPDYYITPVPTCCRAMLMCTSDLVPLTIFINKSYVGQKEITP